MEEHRRAVRRKTLKSAKIIFNNRFSVIDCTVRNLSASGASLLVASTASVPSEFELLIEQNQAEFHCKVQWRKEKQLGVVFS